LNHRTSPELQKQLLNNSTHTQRTAAIQSPPTTIPPFKNSSRRPANIPLRTLSTPASRSDPHSAALLGAEKQGRRSSLSRSSSEDSWSDTGDLAEQLADEEDPLQIKLRASLDEEVFGGSSRRPLRNKRVRYQNNTKDTEEKGFHPGFVKEDIEIPTPGPRYISRAEHILAAIMSGGERQMHGLTGKSLV
jgi:hypothetical protein